MSAASLAEILASLIGPGKVTTTADILATHSTDKWYASHEPDVVVFAESTADVSAVLAYANEHHIPITTRGAGVGYVGGCVPITGGIVLSVIRMNRILGLHPEDGVVIVQPGVITRTVQDAARAVRLKELADRCFFKSLSQVYSERCFSV